MVSYRQDVLSRVCGLAKQSDVPEEILRPGDVILRSMGPAKPQETLLDRLGDSLYRSGAPALQGSWAHAMLYEGGGRVLESNDDGVRSVSLDSALRGSDTHMVLRHVDPEVDPGEVLAAARAHLGEPYGGKRMVAAGASAILPVPMLRAVRAAVGEDGPICSSLVATAYEDAGHPIMDRIPPEIAGPTDLARSPALEPVWLSGDERRALVGRHAPLLPQLAVGSALVGGATFLATRGRRLR